MLHGLKFRVIPWHKTLHSSYYTKSDLITEHNFLLRFNCSILINLSKVKPFLPHCLCEHWYLSSTGTWYTQALLHAMANGLLFSNKTAVIAGSDITSCFKILLILGDVFLYAPEPFFHYGIVHDDDDASFDKYPLLTSKISGPGYYRLSILYQSHGTKFACICSLSIHCLPWELNYRTWTLLHKWKPGPER